METKIAQHYLSDITKIMESLSSVDSSAEWLWVTGPVKVTDGETVYTLVSEDDNWWLLPTVEKHPDAP